MAENNKQLASSSKPAQPQAAVPFKIEMANITGIPLPFAFRKGSQGDLTIIKSIFEKQEYNLPVKNFYPKLILDCGGNIGCSAVYFANKYPGAQIYCLEPQADNFKLLKYNTMFYEKVHPMNTALWDKETFIKVEDKGFGLAGFMTFETDSSDSDALKTTTVSKLLEQSGFDEIDLLKIDIEGAEKEVFGAEDIHDWLSKVKILTIELHDRMKRGCSYEVFKAISKYKWFFAFRGENLIFIREK